MIGDDDDDDDDDAQAGVWELLLRSPSTHSGPVRVVREFIYPVNELRRSGPVRTRWSTNKKGNKTQVSKENCAEEEKKNERTVTQSATPNGHQQHERRSSPMVPKCTPRFRFQAPA